MEGVQSFLKLMIIDKYSCKIITFCGSVLPSVLVNLKKSLGKMKNQQKIYLEKSYRKWLIPIFIIFSLFP